MVAVSKAQACKPCARNSPSTMCASARSGVQCTRCTLPSCLLLDWHAGHGARIRIQQEQIGPAAAGRKDHAFGDAEAHLARREVRDEHDAAPDQLRRFAIGGADAREDLALAEFAGVELEAQQLVRAFDELAGQYPSDAQVESGEVVDRDGGAGFRDWG